MRLRQWQWLSRERFRMVFFGGVAGSAPGLFFFFLSACFAREECVSLMSGAAIVYVFWRVSLVVRGGGGGGGGGLRAVCCFFFSFLLTGPVYCWAQNLEDLRLGHAEQRLCLAERRLSTGQA